MSKETKDEAVEPKVEVETKEEVVEPKHDGSVDVLSPSGQMVRVYCVDDHGKDYLKLAKEFIASHPGYTLR